MRVAMVGGRLPRAARARRWSIAVALAFLLPALVRVDGAMAQAAEPVIVFDGGGYGHGVGLSQYGAKGQALDGRTADQIVTHYYSGTEVADISELPIPGELTEQPLWVGLRQDLTTATVAWSGGPGTVCIDPGADGSCAATVNVRNGEHFTFDWDGALDACHLTRITIDGEVKPLGVTAPDCRLSLVAGDVMWFEARAYPSESIELRRVPAADAFHVVAVIEMERYVAGIAEVPSTWPAAAVDAQALAARSFALNRYLAYEKPELRAPGDTGLSDSAKDNCWCHVYDDTRSQVYGGTEAMTDGRVAAAERTAGRVIAYSGDAWSSYTRYQVIEAYYSSSNGGVSVSNVDAWGSSKQYPYLVSVDDPWSVAPATENPYAGWSLERTPGDLASKLGWDEVVGAALVSADPAVVRFEGRDDGALVSVALTGDTLRGTASLLSAQVSGVQLGGVPACRDRFATIWGTSGPDVLLGTAADDVIVGLGGADVIKGRGGDDLICGNKGADTIDGNNGADTIYGGAHDDVIRGGGGLDTIYGGGGSDTIDGGNGADTIHGDRGLDAINGSGGTDTVYGGGGGDTIDGGSGVDHLLGNAGADTISGSGNPDVLRGGTGPDVLDGGDADGDECRGGGGVDEATAACEVVINVP